MPQIGIIGAGVAGLSAGIHAQLAGYQSTIYEHHRIPGGLVTSWELDEYLCDGSIHFITGYRPEDNFYTVLERLGLHDIPFIPLKRYGQYFFQEQGPFVLHGDLETLQQELISAFPKDAAKIKMLLRAARAISKFDLTTFGFEYATEIQSLPSKLWDFLRIYKLWPYFTLRYDQRLDKFVSSFHHEPLAKMLLEVFLPDVPVWFVSMTLGNLARGVYATVPKGSQHVANTMASRYEDLGGKIIYNTRIKQILFENDYAYAIRDQRKNRFETKYVISAIDGHQTLYELLNQLPKRKQTDKRFREFQVSSSLVMINYGVKLDGKIQEIFEMWPSYSVFHPSSPVAYEENTIDSLMVRFFNYGRFAPDGYGVVQVMFPQSFQYWYYRETTNRVRYLELKQKVADLVAKALEEYLPAFSKLIQKVDVATPYTFWRYTHNREGAYMGWLPAKETIMKKPKKQVAGLKNVILAGQWSMATGGLTASIFSGIHAIQIVEKLEKRNKLL